MTTKEALRSIMELEGVKVCTLADRMGKPDRFITDRLASKNMTINNLNELLRMLDYKIVLLPRDVRTPSNGIDID